MTVVSSEDLDYIVECDLAAALDGGYPPRNLDAWIASVRRQLHECETDRPGYVAKKAAGLRARERGQRVTGWREVRGTHGMTYDRDPNGTDRPPWL